MSFTSCRRNNHPQANIINEDDQQYVNPISKINKGLKKGKYFHQIHTPSHHLQVEPSTVENKRFSSLSKNKENNYFSDNKLEDKEGNEVKILDRIRKRLNFQNAQRSTSNQKGLTFSDAVKLSRQKSLKAESIKQKSVKKSIIIQKQMNSFNKLKNRLMGPNKLEQKAIKDRQQILAAAKQQDLDMVRVSSNFNQLQSNYELTMQPTF